MPQILSSSRHRWPGFGWSVERVLASPRALLCLGVLLYKHGGGGGDGWRGGLPSTQPSITSGLNPANQSWVGMDPNEGFFSTLTWAIRVKLWLHLKQSRTQKIIKKKLTGFNKKITFLLVHCMEALYLRQTAARHSTPVGAGSYPLASWPHQYPSSCQQLPGVPKRSPILVQSWPNPA